MAYIKGIFQFLMMLPELLKLFRELYNQISQWKIDQEIKKAKEAAQKFEDAKTKDEQDEAFDNMLDKSN